MGPARRRSVRRSSLLDTLACETFTEVIVTDKSHPHVMGVRQRVVLGKVSEFDALVTDQGDWLFNADNYLKYSSVHDWGVIPEGARDTRETLRRAIVDPHIGAVVLLAKFTANQLPDSHLFRVESGRIRYVHTLTVCTVPDCGFGRLR